MLEPIQVSEEDVEHFLGSIAGLHAVQASGLGDQYQAEDRSGTSHGYSMRILLGHQAVGQQRASNQIDYVIEHLIEFAVQFVAKSNGSRPSVQIKAEIELVATRVVICP